MATLAERAKAAGLESAAELTRITATSKETLTNWMKDKPVLFEVVLKGAAADRKQEPPQPDGATTPPTQTWCFTPEELKEQARLLELMTTENAQLKAELELLKKQTNQPKNALIGKRFTFEWNGVKRVIRRTEKEWRYREEGSLKETVVSFVNDKAIKCKKDAWFIDLGGNDGVMELEEF